jgi:hypothetical protein
MTYRYDSTILFLLAQTLMISAGGFLFVSLLARGSNMSDIELLIGPASVGLMWLGMGRIKDGSTHGD